MNRQAIITILGVALASWATAASKDIERLQIQVAALQGQMSDLQRTSEDGLREIRRLNELLAEQNALLKRAAQEERTQDEAIQITLKEIADRLGELRERLQTVAAVPSVPTAPPSASVASPAPAEGVGAPPPPTGTTAALPPARELYSQAYADCARGNYDLGIQGFREYLRVYPATELSDNAQYWIGECHYGKQRFPEAIAAWDTLFRDFPASDKLPDGHYKKGVALERLGRRSDALAEFRVVRDRFPNTEAGRKARERLNP